MPRGGARSGTPGASYSNRTDLAQDPRLAGQPAALPIIHPPSTEYGTGVALANAQKQVPAANGPLPTAPGGPPGSPPAPTPDGPPAPTGPAPGFLGPIHGPTQYPDEHVMTGVAQGPGAGPEALPPSVAPQNRFQNVRDLVTSLAQQSSSPALASLAMYARNGL